MCGYDRLETVAKLYVDKSQPGKPNNIDWMLNYIIT